LGWLQAAALLLGAGLAVVVAFVPRRRDIGRAAALAAAVLLALQLAVDHWFFLYVPWVLPLVLVAVGCRYVPNVWGDRR
ncbi:MAG TPA: hypothetical protein VNP96_06040, partial [Solirubrobacterales bacterium]|nr:hypothetical protein [Solirubrobacterales bacterium]